MQDAQCLKVKPRERAFKQFKSPVLNVLRELIQDVKYEDQLSEVRKAAWESLHNVSTSFWTIIRQKNILIWWLMMQNPTNLGDVIRLYKSISYTLIWTFSQKISRRCATNTNSDFSRTFPPRKSGTKGSGVAVCWLIIDGHFEQKFHRQNIA